MDTVTQIFDIAKNYPRKGWRTIEQTLLRGIQNGLSVTKQWMGPEEYVLHICNLDESDRVLTVSNKPWNMMTLYYDWHDSREHDEMRRNVLAPKFWELYEELNQ